LILYVCTIADWIGRAEQMLKQQRVDFASGSAHRILIEIGTMPGSLGDATYPPPDAGTRPHKSRLQKAFTLVKILPRIDSLLF